MHFLNINMHDSSECEYKDNRTLVHNEISMQKSWPCITYLTYHSLQGQSKDIPVDANPSSKGKIKERIASDRLKKKTWHNNLLKITKLRIALHETVEQTCKAIQMINDLVRKFKQTNKKLTLKINISYLFFCFSLQGNV